MRAALLGFRPAPALVAPRRPHGFAVCQPLRKAPPRRQTAAEPPADPLLPLPPPPPPSEHEQAPQPLPLAAAGAQAPLPLPLAAVDAQQAPSPPPLASAGAHQAPDDIHLTPGISNGQYLLYCCGSLVFAALAHHGGFHSIARLFLAIVFYFFMFGTFLGDPLVELPWSSPPPPPPLAAVGGQQAPPLPLRQAAQRAQQPRHADPVALFGTWQSKALCGIVLLLGAACAYWLGCYETVGAFLFLFACFCVLCPHFAEDGMA